MSATVYKFINDKTEEVVKIVLEDDPTLSDEQYEHLAYDTLADKIKEPIGRDKPGDWYLDDIYPLEDEE